MRINLEVSELQAFIAVAEKSSFKAAAESLFITQPALSRRIEKLEATLQTRLLERTTRRVSLTEAGQQFLKHAEAVVEELESALRGMAERSALRRETITLACVPSVANYLLPQVLADFAQDHPGVRMRIIDESAGQVLESVMSGVADFGVNFVGTQEAEIDFKAIYTEHYRVMLRREHPLAGAASISWEQLAGEKLVSVSKSSGNRLLIDHALARVSPRPSIQYEINHVAGAMGLVEAGLGVAILPGLALLPLSRPELLSLPLAGPPPITRTLGLITRKGVRLSPAAQALAGLLEARVGQLPPGDA